MITNIIYAFIPDVVRLRYLKVYYTKMMQIIPQIYNILLSTIVVKSKQDFSTAWQSPGHI